MDLRTASTTSQRANELATAGQVREAYDLLRKATLNGDSLAAATLADWRMSGQFIPRDIAEARRLYGHALKLGLPEAAAPYVALLASGAGGEGRDWRGALKLLEHLAPSDLAANVQLALLGAMTLSPEGEPLDKPRRQPLFAEPQIEHLPAFLTHNECEYLMRIAAPRLTQALVIDPRTGAQRPDPVRIARAAGFPFVAEDPVLHAINRRIAAASGTSWEQGEPAQVLAYRPGEEYRLHSDALPAAHNQRIITFLVALNEDYEGGATTFPALGINWRGRRGDALMFRNTAPDGSPAPAAQHAGSPVESGSKFILSRWIRERPLDLTGPSRRAP